MVNVLLGKNQLNHEYLYWEFHERGFSRVAAQHPEIVARIAEIMQTAHTDSKEFPITERKT